MIKKICIGLLSVAMLGCSATLEVVEPEKPVTRPKEPIIVVKPIDITIKATVVRVYDGDTIFVDIEEENTLEVFGKEIGIRIAGIDTPELKGAKCKNEKTLAILARALVLLKAPPGTEVELRNVERGKFFRLVADVYVGDVSLSDLLLRAKLAVPYDGGTKVKDWCEKDD